MYIYLNNFFFFLSFLLLETSNINTVWALDFLRRLSDYINTFSSAETNVMGLRYCLLLISRVCAIEVMFKFCLK